MHRTVIQLLTESRHVFHESMKAKRVRNQVANVLARVNGVKVTQHLTKLFYFRKRKGES